MTQRRHRASTFRLSLAAFLFEHDGSRPIRTMKNVVLSRYDISGASGLSCALSRPSHALGDRSVGNSPYAAQNGFEACALGPTGGRAMTGV